METDPVRGEGEQLDLLDGTVSVVVVSYFTGPLLWRCLAAALAQPEVRDVVVVDNGNWDRTRDDLALMAEADDRVHVVTGQGNVGFAAGCNLGVAAASGEVIFILNPDAILAPGAVATLLREGRRYGGRGAWLIGGRLLNPDGTVQAGARRGALTPWTALVEMTRLYRVAPRHPYFRRFNQHGEPEPDGTVPMPVISGACMMMPRETYEAVGGMDEAYFLHVEDVDFCVRVGAAGGKVLYTPKAEVTHYKSSSRANRFRIEQLKAHSLHLYFRRHFSGVYPPGFLTLVSAVSWGGVGLRMAKLTAQRTIGLTGVGRRSGARGGVRAARVTGRAAER
ncbi:glycosyltransferase [Parvularcula dongshanensis]|uniref:glycosyltransferase n=1 Tax=Parvularcula dongshanensis TaxID=1173995 RepID=UPI00160A63C8